MLAWALTALTLRPLQGGLLFALLHLSSLLSDSSGSSAEDPLDAFMTAVRSEAAVDAVERRKLHLHVADLRRDAQRLRKLVELTRPTQMPSLLPRLATAPRPLFVPGHHREQEPRHIRILSDLIIFMTNGSVSHSDNSRIFHLRLDSACIYLPPQNSSGASQQSSIFLNNCKKKGFTGDIKKCKQNYSMQLVCCSPILQKPQCPKLLPVFTHTN